MAHANVLSTEAIGTITTESGTAIALETKSGAQLSTTTTGNMSVFNTETVVIDRESPVSGNAVLSTYTQIYSGECDFQSGGGSQYRNPSGVVDIADAWMSISPDADGNLPAVKVGDRATVTQYVKGVAQTPVVYNVDNASLWSGLLPHLELILKRGPVRYEGRK